MNRAESTSSAPVPKKTQLEEFDLMILGVARGHAEGGEDFDHTGTCPMLPRGKGWFAGQAGPKGITERRKAPSSPYERDRLRIDHEEGPFLYWPAQVTLSFQSMNEPFGLARQAQT